MIDTVITNIKSFEAEANNVKIYPNPVSKNGSLLIESEEMIQKVELMDVVGRVLFSAEQVNSKTFPMINMNVPSGIYYVRIYQKDEKMKTGKIIISE